MDNSEGNETGVEETPSAPTMTGEQTALFKAAQEASMAEPAPIHPLDVLEEKVGRLTDTVRHLAFTVRNIAALLERHYPGALD